MHEHEKVTPCAVSVPVQLMTRKYNIGTERKGKTPDVP